MTTIKMIRIDQLDTYYVYTYYEMRPDI